MKFTEEQYQKIVEINLNTFQIDLVGKLINYLAVDGTVWDDGLNKSLAIANPLTREWAHDKFVEKEKKYHWKLNGLYLERDTSDGSIIFNDTRSSLTESEIREWGYNPEMFDREEVQ